MAESDANREPAADAARYQALLEQEKLAALAEFAAGAGHEINNPLAVIVGRAQLLLRGETHPDRRRDLATIAQQALRVHEMIADLMLFARPPQPKLVVQTLLPLVNKVVQELQPRAALQEISLACESTADGLSAAVDGIQIEVAVRAVIANAIEAASDGGKIQVTLAPTTLDEQPAIGITIQDNGPGIPAEIRRHLFDPFFSGRQAGRGLGLGLAKCWRIVTQHGGKIEVESEPDQGTVVRLLLKA